MRKLPILIIVITGLIVASCGKKAPTITNSIPDEAFLVASVHPKNIFDKGQISSMESLTKEIKEEFVKEIVMDPVKSGLAINEYTFIFMYFEEDNPIIGATAVIDDKGKFEALVNKLLEDEEDMEITTQDELSLLVGEDDAAMAWNDAQMIFLAAPDHGKNAEEWTTTLSSLFSLEKENAITSIVDFNDFSGKMKDMNVWFTGDEMKTIMEKTGAMEDMDFDFPFELYNNYQQMFVEFANGAVYMNGETHLSDDVEKAKDAMFVAKDELNPALLKVAPGNDLLLGMAYSIDIEKLVNLMKDMMPPEIGEVDSQIEQATGVTGNEILDALNGDLVLAVNGAPEGSMIPVEVLIGLGLDDETLQTKLMGTVENMAPVEEDGDFFTINVQGVEIYSGIVDGIWVITNTKGYKDAITGGGLEKTLKDSKFGDFAGGSMGFYMNLDISTYPAGLQGMMSQGGPAAMIQLISESLSYMGMEASNMESETILKTAKDDENSLYTLLQLAEKADQ